MTKEKLVEIIGEEVHWCNGPNAYRFADRILAAIEAEQVVVAEGIVREAEMIEEATYIGGTDIAMAFPNGKKIKVFYVEDK